MKSEKVDKYLAVFKNAWQYNLEFRLDTLVRFLIALISLVSIYYLWNDVFQERASLMGYSKEQIVTYYILVGYLLSSIFCDLSVASEIRNGELSNYIMKPVSYIWYVYWHSLARRVFRLIVAFPVIVLIFVIFKDSVYLVTDPMAYIFLIITTFGAINILFLVDLLIGFIEFWMLFSDSVKMITDSVFRFFAGTLIPMVFLPEVVQKIAAVLPFKYVGFFLIDSFLEKINTQEVLVGIGVQMVWILALGFLAKFVWIRGLRRYEATGS